MMEPGVSAGLAGVLGRHLLLVRSLVLPVTCGLVLPSHRECWSSASARRKDKQSTLNFPETCCVAVKVVSLRFSVGPSGQPA